jgi:adenylate cyclase
MHLFRRPTESPSEPKPFEAREVTVLFSDLEGFTALTEQIPPQEVVGFLNRYFTAMAEPLEAFGGRIDAYMGDAMLVVWDGPDPETDARNAAQAALAMLRRLEDLQHEWLAEGKRPVKARIGLSSGLAIVGEIGSPRFRQWTVIGDVVNTASRLEALNKQLHTDILLSEATYLRIAPWADVRSMGVVTLKGRRERLTCYALLGWRTA